jgi:hypothetical protein
MIGPFWGNVIVIAIGSVITIACFAAMFWMLIRPGERNPEHPKHKILRDDR